MGSVGSSGDAGGLTPRRTRLGGPATDGAGGKDEEVLDQIRWFCEECDMVSHQFLYAPMVGHDAHLASSGMMRRDATRSSTTRHNLA